jgi:hypothetical protein
LGPVLARRLDFLAPFVDENGTVRFPNDLEEISNPEEERIRGMMRAVPT